MTNKEIEEKVIKIQADLKIKGVPISLDDIAEKLKIRIKKAPSDDFSGILIRKGGKALIGINSSESHVRQRFTIAHELGHFFLHMSDDAFVDYKEYRDNQKSIARTPKEKQANMFASCFLMPQSLLKQDIEKLSGTGIYDTEIEELAKKYDVSKEAMTYRIMNLGFLLSR